MFNQSLATGTSWILIKTEAGSTTLLVVRSYLITLDQTMSFIPHINNIISEGTKMLNFIKRNLTILNQEHASACLTIFRICQLSMGSSLRYSHSVY